MQEYKFLTIRYLSLPILLLTVLILFNCSYLGHKSKRDMLIKKWRLLDIVDPDVDAWWEQTRTKYANSDNPELRKMAADAEQNKRELKARYPTTTVEYKADSTYIEILLGGSPQTGRWSLSADGRRLTELNDPDSFGTKWLTVTHEVEISEDRLIKILEKSIGSPQRNIYEPNR